MPYPVIEHLRSGTTLVQLGDRSRSRSRRAYNPHTRFAENFRCAFFQEQEVGSQWVDAYCQRSKIVVENCHTVCAG